MDVLWHVFITCVGLYLMIFLYRLARRPTWSCMAPSELNGRSSLELFRELSRKGSAVVLWVGFDSMEQRNAIVKHFDSGWLSEIHLDLIKNPRSKLNPGVFGCGLYSDNLSSRSVQAVERLGNELARIYEAALLPPGESGRLLYQSRSGCHAPMDFAPR